MSCLPDVCEKCEYTKCLNYKGEKMSILDQIHKIIKKDITNKNGYEIVRFSINDGYAFNYVSLGYILKLLNRNTNKVISAEFFTLEGMAEWLNEKGWNIKF